MLRSNFREEAAARRVRAAALPVHAEQLPLDQSAADAIQARFSRLSCAARRAIARTQPGARFLRDLAASPEARQAALGDAWTRRRAHTVEHLITVAEREGEEACIAACACYAQRA